MVGSFLILPILVSSFRKSEMKIIKQLWWFFRLEKKRYVMGIVSLCLVSALNLLPPYIMLIRLKSFVTVKFVVLNCTTYVHCKVKQHVSKKSVVKIVPWTDVVGMRRGSVSCLFSF